MGTVEIPAEDASDRDDLASLSLALRELELEKVKWIAERTTVAAERQAWSEER